LTGVTCAIFPFNIRAKPIQAARLKITPFSITMELLGVLHL
jgi:hypothetical protein